jgi:hypothetical protein
MLEVVAAIAIVLLVIALKVGSFRFGVWVMDEAPYWVTAPLLMIGGIILVVRIVTWFGQDAPGPSEKETKEIDHVP